MHGRPLQSLHDNKYILVSFRALIALIVLMSLCGCAGCGANRYHYYRRGNGYHNLMPYSSRDNEGIKGHNY